MQCASCRRQPAALFIWLPGESGQLGSAGLKAPGASLLCFPPWALGLSLQVLGLEGKGTQEGTPWEGESWEVQGGAWTFPKQDARLHRSGWKVMSSTERLPGSGRGCELFWL